MLGTWLAAEDRADLAIVPIASSFIEASQVDTSFLDIDMHEPDSSSRESGRQGTQQGCRYPPLPVHRMYGNVLHINARIFLARLPVQELVNNSTYHSAASRSRELRHLVPVHWVVVHLAAAQQLLELPRLVSASRIIRPVDEFT